MGLYDHITCEYPLPDPEAQGLTFQTKDTPNQYLDDYAITAEGRLVERLYKRVPNGKRDRFGFADFDYIPDGTLDLDYHGDLYFYHDQYTYMARFTHGAVEWIKRVEEE